MTNEKIFKSVIKKCVDINPKQFSKFYEWLNAGDWDFDDISNGTVIERGGWNTFNIYGIIFSHEFAKTFFGTQVVDHMIMDDGIQMGDFGEEWQYALKQMVLEENPFKYLERFL